MIHMRVLLLVSIWRTFTVPAPSSAGLGLRNAGDFYPKGLTSRNSCSADRESNISAFVSIVLHAVLCLSYGISGPGFALRNGLCVRVKWHPPVPPSGHGKRFVHVLWGVEGKGRHLSLLSVSYHDPRLSFY